MRKTRFSSVVLALVALYAVGCLEDGDSPDMMSGQSPGVTGQVGGGAPVFDGSVPGSRVDAGAPINPTGGGITGGGTTGGGTTGGGTTGGGFPGGPRNDAGGPMGNPTDAAVSSDARVPSDGAVVPSDGGSTGGAGFDPCPASGPCKILPLGDSITDGIGFSGGYRVQLFRLATMNMKQITYVGSKMNGPQMVDGMPFPRRHEGTSGITIGGLDGRIPMPGLNEIPHIVLLHIGTNDMYMTPSGAPDRLGTLIDGIVMAAPDALIVVSKIIPLSLGGSAVTTYNNAIPAVVQKRIDAGKHIVLIDMFTGFPTSELGDGVHPNQAGYSRMAGKWYEAISKYLK
jgi:GDSL-like Lipase/Acylhydrolase family